MSSGNYRTPELRGAYMSLLLRSRQLAQAFATSQQQQQQQHAAFSHGREMGATTRAGEAELCMVHSLEPGLEMEGARTVGCTRPPSPPMPSRPPTPSPPKEQVNLEERLPLDAWELIFRNALDQEEWSDEAEMCLRLVSKHASLPASRAASHKPAPYVFTTACRQLAVHAILRNELTEEDIGCLALVSRRLNKIFRPRRRIVELLKLVWIGLHVDIYWPADDDTYHGRVVEVFHRGAKLRARVQFDTTVGNVRGVAMLHHTFTFDQLDRGVYE